MKRSKEILSRAQGSLLGQLAGDALGSLVEFRSPKDISREYPHGVRYLADGGTWNLLGTWTFAPGQGVRLEASEGGYVIADALRFVPAAGQPSSGGLFYVHPDHLGTPRAITRPDDNALVWAWPNTDPFGGNAPQEDPSGLGVFAVNLRFPGQYFDAETGALGLLGFMEGDTLPKGVAELPPEVVQEVRDLMAKMLAGEFTRLDVFSGPINDNQGNVIVPAGEKFEQADLDQFPEYGLGCKYCMKWWAEGITAELPSTDS